LRRRSRRDVDQPHLAAGSATSVDGEARSIEADVETVNAVQGGRAQVGELPSCAAGDVNREQRLYASIVSLGRHHVRRGPARAHPPGDQCACGPHEHGRLARRRVKGHDKAFVGIVAHEDHGALRHTDDRAISRRRAGLVADRFGGRQA
jgi:hypothetical protein